MKKVLDERFRDRIKTECISREDAENLYSNESADKLLAYRTILGEKYRGLVSERDRVSNQLTSGAKLTKWAQDEYVKDRLTLWDTTTRLDAIDDRLEELAASPRQKPDGPEAEVSSENSTIAPAETVEKPQVDLAKLFSVDLVKLFSKSAAYRVELLRSLSMPNEHKWDLLDKIALDNERENPYADTNHMKSSISQKIKRDRAK